MTEDDKLVGYLKKVAADLHQTRQRLKEAEDAPNEPVAIVGMACRYPGGITDPGRLWDLVHSGRDAISTLPRDRGWNLDQFQARVDGQPSPLLDAGGFVYDAVDFDPAFFGISPREALAMDPQQRLVLETSWEVFEDAGIDITSLRGSRTGVFVGASSADYLTVVQRITSEAKGYLMTGVGGAALSGRVSYTFGFEGPAVTVDTACSSSLVAIHQAMRSLRSAECSLAVAGGVAVISTPGQFIDFGHLGGLAMDGRCRAFGADATGTGFGEGVGLLLLERLSDAQRLGHQILAVVRGSAVNQDGASNGFTAPNGPSQQRVIRQALASAGIAPSEVDAVEAHGTGTPLGDPIEAQALLATYGQDRAEPLWLGSIKSNIGHTQAAAGVAGVIKMVQAMRHGHLPRTLHVDEPTEHVDWSAGAVKLLAEPRVWESPGRPRRAGVSSFGFSGTNAHVILEEAPEVPGAAPAPVSGAVPWILSGKNAEAVRAQAARLQSFVAERPDLSIADVAYSLVSSRAVLESRAVVAGSSRDELLAALDDVVPTAAGPGGRVVLVFPGQGSQWVGMADALWESSPVFAARMQDCAEALAQHVDWSLREVVADPAALARVDVVQPVLWAVMVSLAELWRSLGVVPAAVVGHSQGEIAAACVAGALSLADGARVVALRSRAILKLAGKGGMVSLSCPLEIAQEVCVASGASIAAVNGAEQIVVSGTVAACDQMISDCERRGVRARRIEVDYASHSVQVETLRDELLEILRPITPVKGAVPVVSTVTGEWLSGQEMDAQYWVDNLRRTVQFSAAITELHSQGYTTFVESSAHPVLTTAISDTIADNGVVAGTLRRDQGDMTQVLRSAGQLWAAGVPVDWAEYLTQWPDARRVPLPTYAFQRQRFWPSAGGPGGDASGLGLAVVEHPLLGAAVSIPGTGGVLLTGRVSVDQLPWLADHRVAGHLLIPGTALVDLAIRAGDEVGCPTLAELTLQAPLVLPEPGAVQLQVWVDAPDEHGHRPVRIRSSTDGPLTEQTWTLHATGVLAPDAPSANADLAEWPPADAEPLAAAELYERFAAMTVEYGPAFRGVREIWRRGEEVFAEVALPAGVDASRFGLHPALLDAAVQPIASTGDGNESTGPWLPFAWRGVALYATGATSLRVRISPTGGNALSISVADHAGEPVAAIDSLVLRQAPGPQEVRQRGNLFHVEWKPVDAVANEIDSVVVGRDPFGLAACLGAQTFTDLTALGTAVDNGRALPQQVFVTPEAPEGELADSVRAITASVLELAQAWLADERFDPARLVVVTHNAVPTDIGPLDLATAALWGLLRSAQTEHPGRFALLDLDTTTPGPADLAGEQPQAAVRNGTRHVPRLVRTQPTEAAHWDVEDGTVLITGATGTLGGLVARHLAGTHGARDLLLLSRSGKESPAAAALVDDLTDLGASVTLVACDVADRDALAAVLAQIPADRPLRAVVHTAGALDDALLTSLTPERLDPVLRPKVNAVLNLHELCPDVSAFVVFSSLAGTFGPAGQANYAAANSFVDALAARRRADGLPATALAWGMWARLSELTGKLADADLARMARSGVVGLSDDEGCSLLDQALATGMPVLAPVHLDLAALRGMASRGLLPPLLEGIVPTPNRRLVDSAAAGAASLRDKLATAPAAQQHRIVLGLIREHAAAVLGHSVDAIDPASPFGDLGFDSLTAVDFRNLLNSMTGLRLSATLVFDYPTPLALTDYLVRELSGAGGSVATTTRRSAGPGEPLAIVGMACRFPGGVASPDQLWQLVEAGGDAISAFPTDRNWDLPPMAGDFCREGGFLYDAARFDAGFFGISPREALVMDPQHRLFLETAWEAFERAGIDPATLRGSDTAVFGGLMYHDYLTQLGGVSGDAAGFIGTGTSGGVLSGRVAYALGLQGPALTVDTACSSSLVALHLAAEALRRGECSLALAGGVTLLSTPGAFADFGRQGGLAADGRCKSFAAAADGTGWGEGVGIVVLERLSDARRNGHEVLALLRGSAVNSDGESNGLTAPNGLAQQRVIRQALSGAGLTTSDVDVVEAHGTGTELGDPIEAQALLATYGQDRDEPLWLGSIKSNIGHTQAAAGVAGVIKMVQAMRHGVLPKTLHVDEPSPHIDWSAGAVELLTESRRWDVDGRPRRAAVSSFGISGTNAHVILEQVPAPAVAERPQEPVVVPWVLSAKSPEALREQAARLKARISGDPAVSPVDVAYSLLTARTAFKHRAVLVGSSRDELLAGLDSVEPVSGGVSGRVAVVFTGQGAQWAGMAAGLYGRFSVFTEAVDEICALMDLDPTIVTDPDAVVDPTGIAQRVLFMVEVALWRQLKAWGVDAEAVAGHSVGEIAAAHVAGVLSLEDACALVSARAKLMQALPEGGAMVSVAASEDAVAPLLVEGVSIAAINGPASVVLSGIGSAVDQVVGALGNVKTRKLRVSHAFHSALMEPMLADFAHAISGIGFGASSLTCVSTVTGAVVSDEWSDPGYWVRQVREPVRFADAVRALTVEVGTVLEIGPDAVLSVMGPDTVPATFLPTLRRDRDTETALVHALARLHIHGVTVDWKAFFAPYQAIRVDLPTYAFQRQHYWPKPAPRADVTSVDQLFWDAVDREDPTALAKVLDVDTNVEFEAVLSVLATWRRKQADDTAAAKLRHHLGWVAIPDTTTTLSGTWRIVVPEDAPFIQDCAAALTARGADVIVVTDPDAVGLLQLRTDAAETWTVTRGAVRVGTNEPLPDPVQAELWDRATTVVDLPQQLDQRAATWLAGVLASGTTEHRIAVRAGRAFARQLEQTQAPAASWRATGPVLVTGAGGALGARVARWAADCEATDLVLAGGGDDLAAELRERGVTVTLADAEAALATGWITAVLHTEPDVPVELTDGLSTVALFSDSEDNAAHRAWAARRRAAGRPATTIAVGTARDELLSKAVRSALADEADVVLTELAPATEPAVETTVVALCDRLVPLPDEDKHGVLLEVLVGEIAAVLGHSSGAAVEPDTEFFDLGLSSLAAVELRNRLIALTEIEIPVDVIYEYPTPDALAEYLRGALA
ncbi:hypothetical protein ALI144C_17105 [Actinosynnema sp. ALI-1.44]|nr:type I polyketide synthase [Actinosynnema sp. ALI-1.44]ONI83212.1 hypothetical protein ALI144C_17105 [Actinosynnema sp. ALI-1.44]